MLIVEELAELVVIHDVLVTETSAFRRCFWVFLDVFLALLNCAAGDSWAFGAELFTVPVIRESRTQAIVIFVLIHSHRLSNDAVGAAPERRLVNNL